tara:strand:+ start:217 stop:411 length:195 start_codon:yes stop_codon:yes gene_type:complete
MIIPTKYWAEAMQVAIPIAANRAFSLAIVVHDRLLLNTDSVDVNLDSWDFIFVFNKDFNIIRVL